MIKELKINKDNLFCMGYSFFLVGQILGHTFINISPIIRYILITIGVALILLKIILFDYIIVNRKSIVAILFFILYFIISLISVKRSGSITPIMAFLLIIGAHNVNFEDIIRIFVYTATILLVITFIAYFLGLITESTATRNGNIRHSFGYRHPTDLIAMITYILMGDMYLCIKHKKLLYPRVILYLFFGFFALIACDARLGSITIFILIPVIFFLYRRNEKNSRIMKFIFRNSFNLGLLLSIVTTQLFTTHINNFLVSLDQLLSYRLTYQVMAVKFFGYSFWGQKIYQEYSQMFDNNSWFFIDSSYYIFLIQYGISLLILWLIFFYLCQRKMLKDENYIIPFLFLIVCIDSLINQYLYSPEYNVFLLSLMANLSASKMIKSRNNEF